MIRPLRTRHRVTFTLLAPLLSVVFALAILGRRPRPVGDLPALGDAPSEVFTVERDVTWSLLDLHTEIAASHVRLVEWDAREAPDALLYWSSAEPAAAGLPAGARLLGALGAPENAPRTLALPAEADGRGWLVLYSLGRSETLGHTPLGEGR